MIEYPETSTRDDRVPDRTYVDEYPADALSPRRKSVYGSQNAVSKSSTSAAAPEDEPVRIARTPNASRISRRPRNAPSPFGAERRPSQPSARGIGGSPYEVAALGPPFIDHCRCPFQSECLLPQEMRIGIVFRASNITPYYFGASRGTLHGSIRASRSLGRHELGERKSGGPERPNRRGRLRSDLELQPGSHPRVRPHRLAEGHQRPRDAGHRIEEGPGVALRPPRDHEQAPDRPVQGLQQLVRGLRVLGLQVLRRRQRRLAEWRAEKVDRAGPARDEGSALPPGRLVDSEGTGVERQSIPPLRQRVI